MDTKIEIINNSFSRIMDDEFLCKLGFRYNDTFNVLLIFYLRKNMTDNDFLMLTIYDENKNTRAVYKYNLKAGMPFDKSIDVKTINEVACNIKEYILNKNDELLRRIFL